MSGWQEAYETGAFAITTDQPSVIVEDYAHLIPRGSRVVDLGCGAGRNALFLASLGHPVDAFDVADLGWLEKPRPDDSAPVSFSQEDVANVQLDESSLGAVLMMRLIQYLPTDQVERLIVDAHQGLVENGVLFINYTVFGGIHDIPSVSVEKHRHPFSEVLEVVDSAGFKVVHAEEADMPPAHTNLDSGDIHACDLVAVA